MALVSVLTLMLAPGVAWAQGPVGTAKEARPAAVARVAAPAKAAPTVTEVRLQTAMIALDLPQGWKSEVMPGKTEARTLSSPDGVTTLMLFTAAAKDMDSAVGDLDKTLQGVVTGASVEKPREGLVGGMPAIMVDGRGTIDGNEVDLGVLVVLNEFRQKVLFLVGFTLPGRGDGYARDVAAILNSVREVR